MMPPSPTSCVRETIFELVRFGIATAATLALYNVQYAVFNNWLDPGTFTSNLAVGILALSIALLANYFLCKNFVYRIDDTKKTVLPRYVVFALVFIIASTLLAWVVQDFLGFGVTLASYTMGILCTCVCWVALRLFVFNGKPTVKGWIRVLSSIVLMASTALLLQGLILIGERIALSHAESVVSHTSSELTPIENSGAQGRFVVHSNLGYIGVDLEKAQGVDVVWDDNWFFGDSYEYNHELGRAAIVLSGYANTESDSFSNPGIPDCFTQLLGDLGFECMGVESYEYRSTIADNIASLVSGETDTVAYAIATKKLVSEDGSEKTLVLLAVRGSYGSEWLSNFNIEDPEVGGKMDGAHVGFRLATEAAFVNLSKVLVDHEGEDVAVLITGHSRGGAVSNLAAAQLDGLVLSGGVSSLDAGSVFAYTFAAPQVTLDTNVHDDVYGNIFNIALPSDMVPHLPLSEWGYDLYGIDLRFPRPGDAGFDDAYQTARNFYSRSFGMDYPSDPNDAFALDKAMGDLVQKLPSAKSMGSPESLRALIHLVVLDINPTRVLASHYIPTYIAWMNACDASAMMVGK